MNSTQLLRITTKKNPMTSMRENARQEEQPRIARYIVVLKNQNGRLHVL